MSWLVALLLSLTLKVDPVVGSAPYRPLIEVTTDEDTVVCLVVENENHDPIAKFCEQTVDKKVVFPTGTATPGKYHLWAAPADGDGSVHSEEVDIEVTPPTPGVKAE